MNKTPARTLMEASDDDCCRIDRRRREPGILPGVYAPQADTQLLARALHAEGIMAGMDVLDVCTGSGALALLVL